MARRRLRRIDGLPLIDASKPRLVTITNDDIRDAMPRDGDYCAAAMALCRDETIEDAYVYMGRTYIRFHNRWERYLTPRALRRQLISFDRKGVFDAGTYRLNAPPPTARLGNGYQTAYAQAHARSRSKARGIVHRVKGVRPHAPRIVGDHIALTG
jgi:hypothetical protein